MSSVNASARETAATTLAAVAARLRCPTCGVSLNHADRALACARGHSFDLARHGHVALAPRRGRIARGDSTAMVAARETFLGGGHYAPIADAITAAARPLVGQVAEDARAVVDLGAGTGYYLATLLNELPDWWGIALDSSRAALRRAVHAHPRIAAIACDVWQELPVQNATAGLVVNVFAPRNEHEVARVLCAQGALVVVTPTPHHLQELVLKLGLLGIEEGKQARLHAKLARQFRAVGRRQIEFDMTLGHEDIQALTAMGPNAHHVSADDVCQRLAHVADDLRVTASVIVETFRRI